MENFGIRISDLRKNYGPVTALAGMDFQALPGRVTALLGPNGSGKTTTLRLLLGLQQADSGQAELFDFRNGAGVAMTEVRNRAQALGAVLDSDGIHPGRTPRNHLRALATTAGVLETVVADVLAGVGLSEVADRRMGGFSLGMRRRVALGAALLGDPQVLVLDEPTNGLDPNGIRWLHQLVRSHAAQGACVLLATHHLAEAADIADDVVIVAHGQVKAAGSLTELTAKDGLAHVYFQATEVAQS